MLVDFGENKYPLGGGLLVTALLPGLRNEQQFRLLATLAEPFLSDLARTP